MYQKRGEATSLLIICLLLVFNLSNVVAQRVIGGVDAPEGAYSFVAGLSLKDIPQLKDGQFCGATLVHKDWVLTAAHCLDDIDSLGHLQVFLGTNDLENPKAGFELIDVEEWVLHPDYLPNNGFRNDVALLKLRRPSNQSIVTLSNFPDYFLSQPGTPSRVLGWGVADTSLLAANYLQQADILVISNDDCNKAESYGGGVTEEMMCAGFIEGETPLGAASGDSGGPLLVFYDNRWFQIGIISWGREKWTTRDFPGVFQRIDYFYSWIQSVIDDPTPVRSLPGSENPVDIEVRHSNLVITFAPADRQAYQIGLFDVMGRQIHSIQVSAISSPTYQLSLTGLHTGQYFVRLVSGENQLSRAIQFHAY